MACSCISVGDFQPRPAHASASSAHTPRARKLAASFATSGAPVVMQAGERGGGGGGSSAREAGQPAGRTRLAEPVTRSAPAGSSCVSLVLAARLHGPGAERPGSRRREEGRRQKGEASLRAAAAAHARGQEAAPSRRGRGQQAADGGAVVQVQAAATEAGAREGLPAHGGGVCDQPGAAQAAGGARRGGADQGGRPAGHPHERGLPGGAHRRQVRALLQTAPSLLPWPCVARLPGSPSPHPAPVSQPCHRVKLGGAGILCEHPLLRGQVPGTQTVGAMCPSCLAPRAARLPDARCPRPAGARMQCAAAQQEHVGRGHLVGRGGPPGQRHEGTSQGPVHCVAAAPRNSPPVPCRWRKRRWSRTRTLAGWRSRSRRSRRQWSCR